MTQRFDAGDLVRIAKDLGPSMWHFPSDRDAIVIGSYADQFGGRNFGDYTLYINGEGEVSWYHEPQLTLIARGRLDLLEQWKSEADAEKKQKSDLDWIFAHGDEVIARPHGATVAALGKTIGITDLWGVRGEGITYYSNAAMILALASPYLASRDKTGWLRFAGDRVR